MLSILAASAETDKIRTVCRVQIMREDSKSSRQSTRYDDDKQDTTTSGGENHFPVTVFSMRSPQGQLESAASVRAFAQKQLPVTLFSARSPHGGSTRSPVSAGREEDATWAEDERAVFWEDTRQKMAQLQDLARGGGGWPFPGWGAPTGVFVGDTVKCLRDLRLASDTDQTNDTNSQACFELIEDAAFLRDQVRHARREMLEDQLEQRQMQDVSFSSPERSVTVFGLFGVSSDDEQRVEGCVRCARLFAHVHNIEIQRGQMQKAIVKHRIRVGMWEKKRLKTASQMWLQAAQLGASLEHIVRELADLKANFDNDAPLFFFSSVLLGRKSQFGGSNRSSLKGPSRASWNAGSSRQNGHASLSIRNAEQTSQRRSLPVHSSLAVDLQRNMNSAYAPLETMTEEIAENVQRHSIQLDNEQLRKVNLQLQAEVTQIREQLATDMANDIGHASGGEDRAFEAMEARVKKAERENAALREALLEITALEKKIEEQDAQWANEVAIMNDKLSNQAVHADRFKDEAERLKQQAAQAQDYLQSHKAKASQVQPLQEKLERAVQERENIKAQLSARNTEVKEVPVLKEKLSTVIKKAEQFKTLNLDLERKLCAIKVEIQQLPLLRDKLGHKTEIVEGLKKQVALLQVDLTNARERSAYLDRCIQNTVQAAEIDHQDRDAEHAAHLDEVRAHQLTQIRHLEQQLEDQNSAHENELEERNARNKLLDQRIGHLANDLATAKEEERAAMDSRNTCEEILRTRVLELARSQNIEQAGNEQIKYLEESVVIAKKQLDRMKELYERERKEKENYGIRVRELEDEASSHMATGVDRDALQQMWQQYKEMHEQERKHKIKLKQDLVDFVGSTRDTYKIEMMKLKMMLKNATTELEDVQAIVVQQDQQQMSLLARTLHQHQVTMAQEAIALDGLKTQNLDLETQICRVESEKNVLVASMGRCQEEALVRSQEAGTLKETYEQLELESNTVIAELEFKITNQDEQWTADVHTLKDKVQAAKHEIHQLHQSVLNCETQKLQTEESLRRSVEEALAYKKSIMVLKCAIKDVEEHRDEIRGAYNKGETVRESMRNNAEDLSKSHSELQARVLSLTSDNENLRTKLGDSQRQVMEISGIVSTKQNSLDKKDAALAEAKLEIVGCGHEKCVLQTSFDALIVKTESEIDSLDKKHTLRMQEVIQHEKDRSKAELDEMNDRQRRCALELGTKHAAEIKGTQAKHVALLKQQEDDCRAKLEAMGQENLRKLTLRKPQTQSDMDQFKAGCLRDKERAIDIERVEHVRLQQTLDKCRADLEEEERKVVLKKQSCIVLEETLQCTSEQVSELLQKCAAFERNAHCLEQLQQEATALQQRLDCKCVELNNVKLEWAQKVRDATNKCALLEESVGCLSRENKALKETLDKSKISLRGQWEQYEIVGEEAKLAGSERDNLKQGVAKLEKQLAASKDECTGHLHEFQRVLDLNKGMDKQIKSLDCNLNDVTRYLRIAAKQCDQMIGSLAAESNQSKDLQVKSQKAQISELQHTIERTQSETYSNASEMHVVANAGQQHLIARAVVQDVTDKLRAVQEKLTTEQHAAREVVVERDAALLLCERERKLKETVQCRVKRAIECIRTLHVSRMSAVSRQVVEAEEEVAMVREAGFTQGRDLRGAVAAYSSVVLQYEGVQQHLIAKEHIWKDRLEATEHDCVRQVARYEQTLSEMLDEKAQCLRQRDDRIKELLTLAAEERHEKEARIKAMCEEQATHVNVVMKRDETIAELKKAAVAQAARTQEDSDKKDAAVKRIKEDARQTKDTTEARIKEVQATAQQVCMESDLLKESCCSMLSEIEGLSGAEAVMQERLHALQQDIAKLMATLAQIQKASADRDDNVAAISRQMSEEKVRNLAAEKHVSCWHESEIAERDRLHVSEMNELKKRIDQMHLAIATAAEEMEHKSSTNQEVCHQHDIASASLQESFVERDALKKACRKIEEELGERRAGECKLKELLAQELLAQHQQNTLLERGELDKRWCDVVLERDCMRQGLKVCRLRLDACQLELAQITAEATQQSIALQTFEEVAANAERELEVMKKECKWNEDALAATKHKLSDIKALHEDARKHDDLALAQAQKDLDNVRSQLSGVVQQSHVQATERETLETLCKTLKNDLVDANRAREERDKTKSALLPAQMSSWSPTLESASTQHDAHDPDVYASSSIVQASLRAISGEGLFSSDQDKKMRELQRSLTRVVSENGDYRRSESSLKQQVSVIDTALILLEQRLEHLARWSLCHVGLLRWRLLRRSSLSHPGGSSSPTTDLPHARECLNASIDSSAASQVAESVSNADDGVQYESGLMQMPQSYMAQFSNVYSDVALRDKADRFQEHVAILRARQLTLTGIVKVRIRLRGMSTVLVNWRLYMIKRLHCHAVTRSVLERGRGKLKRFAFDILSDQNAYKAALVIAASAMALLVPRVLLKQVLGRWLHEVDRSSSSVALSCSSFSVLFSQLLSCVCSFLSCSFVSLSYSCISSCLSAWKKGWRKGIRYTLPVSIFACTYIHAQERTASDDHDAYGCSMVSRRN